MKEIGICTVFLVLFVCADVSTIYFKTASLYYNLYFILAVILFHVVKNLASFNVNLYHKLWVTTSDFGLSVEFDVVTNRRF